MKFLMVDLRTSSEQCHKKQVMGILMYLQKYLEVGCIIFVNRVVHAAVHLGKRRGNPRGTT